MATIAALKQPLLEKLISENGYKVGQLKCNRFPDQPFLIENGQQLYGLRKKFHQDLIFLKFESLMINELHEFNHFFFFSKKVTYPNPKKRPEGRFALIPQIFYEAELTKERLVGSIDTSNPEFINIFSHDANHVVEMFQLTDELKKLDFLKRQKLIFKPGENLDFVEL